MTVPGRLSIDGEGRITGPARITFNDPWPCANGNGPNVTGAMQGVLMHTTAGTFDACIAWFNNPTAQASANFVIHEDGQIHQFFPLGKGWMAWHAEAANKTWYGIEHADNGNPDTPLTDQQIVSSAQLVELLSRFAGFPLQVTDNPAGRGYGVHFAGGAQWGGHTCPDVPPAHVRSAQRPAILALAELIRTPPPPWQHSALEHAEACAVELDALHALLAANQ